MKNIHIIIFSLIISLSFIDHQYIQIDKVFSPATAMLLKKTNWERSNNVFSFMNRRVSDSNKYKSEESLKSADVKQVNYVNHIVHRIVHTKSTNSVLRIILRNRENIDGQTEGQRMIMFALGLPNHISKADIDSIRFTRKEYTDVDDLDDFSGLYWEKMEVPDLIVLEDISEYTKSKVLKIEKGINENDWLIVEISFNKLYLDAEYMPYYFKMAENWYPTTYLGVGKLNPEFHEEN